MPYASSLATCSRYWSRLERVEDVLVLQAGRIGRKALELGERPGEARPERPDLRRVPFPDAS